MQTQEIQMFSSTVKYSYSDDHIFIQPFCDFFQIDYINQKKAIIRNPLLKRCASKNTSILLFGDQKERVTLTKQGFITWILQLRVQIVHPNLQEKLLQYQTLIFDYMFGALKREENAKAQYARLGKLKKLKTKITAHIAECEAEVNDYLENRFIQTKLPLEENSKIKTAFDLLEQEQHE